MDAVDIAKGVKGGVPTSATGQIEHTGQVIHAHRSSTRRRLATTIGAMICGVVLLAGCGAATQSNTAAGGAAESTLSFDEEKAQAEKLSPLVDDWKNLLASRELSAFERDVLTRAVRNGRISQDDYEQAQAQYLQCMSQEGEDSLVFDKLPNGLYRLNQNSPTGDGYADAMLKCSEGTTSIIEAAYRDQQDNPDRFKDHGILAAQCLRDNGIVDESYTAAQFNHAIKQFGDNREQSSEQAISDVFGFPVHSGDSQTLYCLYLGGLSLAGDF